MSDKIWNSENFRAYKSDVFSVDDRDGYLKNIRIYKLENGSRVMHCQLFRANLEKYAEQTIILRNESDSDAITLGMGALQYLIANTKR